MTGANYPSRDRFFSHRFVRLLTKACVAQDIGPTGVWLLAVIAHQEDAACYRRAVTFWDGQLMPILGVTDQKTLASARRKAVDSGWLHYEAGRKGIPGRYWVMVPSHAEDLDDLSSDEGPKIFTGKNGVQIGSQTEANGDNSVSRADSPEKAVPQKEPKRKQNGTKKEAKGNHSSLSLSQYCSPSQEREVPQLAAHSRDDEQDAASDNGQPKRFVPPTAEQVAAYCVERKIQVDPQKFVDYYESNGWKVGRSKMVDWKAALRNWGRNNISARNATPGGPDLFEGIRGFLHGGFNDRA